MRLLLYEWCCSGGLTGPDLRRVVRAGDEVEALAREGRAMLLGLLADAGRDGRLEVSAMVDEARPLGPREGVGMRSVPRGQEIEVLVAESRRADATLIVAPETAGVLGERVAAVRAAGGRVLAPSGGFIGIASDKQTTIDTLAGAGIAVPAGRSLPAGAEWPRWFRLPAVRKHRSSVGCDEALIVAVGDELPSPSAVATRLEAFVEGVTIGVSCIVGPAGIHPLPPMRQHFAGGRFPRYLGAAPLIEPLLRLRATRLAVRSVAAVAAAAGGTQAGWVGVDMILGGRRDGLDDRVLEVNPRLTTSFVGLAAAASHSLVRAIITAAEGRRPSIADCSAAAFTVADDESASPGTT
jgi:predicted ATP-grasp superfamily ATP-dependent carboligase